MKTTVLLLLSALASTLDIDAASRSANYSISTDMLGAGGRRSASASYAADATLSPITGTSASLTSLYSARHGYAGQLFEPMHLVLTSSPPALVEGATATLSVAAVNDDRTISRIRAGEISWLVSYSNGVAVVLLNEGTGLLTAERVYQPEPFTVFARYRNLSTNLALSVINTNLDDWGAYAADGLNDAWQVQHFGRNHPEAGPSGDVDRDGQGNAFEYAAGTDPADSASGFRLSIAPVPGQRFHKAISFSPRLPDRTYQIEFRPNFDVPFSVLDRPSVIDVGNTRTVTDTTATNASRLYRVRISGP